jgi:hypothetical protein
MALTGHLSDLSLSELIEFFCNQRKSGRLKVLYPEGAGYFFLQTGSVVDARIGVLRGCDAVYYALTLPNAEFEFNVDAETSERTINQPWTQVVLEGLRRLDESITPGVAFPEGYVPEADELEVATTDSDSSQESHRSFPPAFLGFTESQGRRKPLFIGAIVVAVLGSVAAIGVPAGWYHKKPAAVVESSSQQAPSPQATQAQTATQPEPVATESNASDDAAAAAKRQREKDKKARDARAEAASNVAPAPVANPAATGKRVVVTVTYDEAGRVTSTSGGDAVRCESRDETISTRKSRISVSNDFKSIS